MSNKPMFFLSFIFIVQCTVVYSSNDSVQRLSFTQKINTKWQEFKNNWWDTNYGILGNQPLSIENETFVRSILHELNMPNADSIKLYKLSNYAQQYTQLGSANAIAASALYFTGARMYISQDWFNTLTLAEKRFLIGHEAMHIKCNHLRKRYGLQLLLSAMTSAVILGIPIKYNHQFSQIIQWLGDFVGNKIARLYVYLGLAEGALGVTYVMVRGMCYYSRLNELEADKLAALQLDCIDGGIALMHRFKSMYAELQEELPNTLCIDPAKTNVFASHPSFDERIAQFEQLKT